MPVTGTGTDFCWFLCSGQEKKEGRGWGGGGGGGGGTPALAGTREYKQVEGGLRCYGTSCRIKPKRIMCVFQ